MSVSWVALEAASFRRLRLPAPTSSVAAVITAPVSRTEPPMEPGLSRASQIAEPWHTLRLLERCRQDLESDLVAPACASGERGTPSPPTPTPRSAPRASS
eukprot:scaffold37273_cov56-Phaeocystis_antarctica.AAC.3